MRQQTKPRTLVSNPRLILARNLLGSVLHALHEVVDTLLRLLTDVISGVAAIRGGSACSKQQRLSAAMGVYSEPNGVASSLVQVASWLQAIVCKR